MNHILSVKHFQKEWIEHIFSVTNELRTSPQQCCAGRVIATLFYEPSTRTRFSFESAIHRLGGSCITTENAAEFSSATKGETLEDSIRVIGSYVDLIVLRHPQEHAAERAAAVSSVPIINAGDGSHEHPTQALLDLYTIQNTYEKIDGIHVVFVGDLKYGRTVHSLAQLLCLYKNIHISFVAPKSLQIPTAISEELSKKGVAWELHDNLQTPLTTADVVYQTRVQKERLSVDDVHVDTKNYSIGTDELSYLQKHAIIMHPLPRNSELSPEIDDTKHATYFKQAENGLYIRMALLQEVLY